MKSHSILFLLLVVGISASSCFYPVFTVKRVEKGLQYPGRHVSISSRAHLRDGSVILFEYGYDVDPDTVIRGLGIKYSLDRKSKTSGEWTIPFDSLQGMEYYDNDYNVGRVFAGLFIFVGTVAGIKATFGSCPTVYSSDGVTQHLEAECFSHSIGKTFERGDLDRISQRGPEHGSFTLRIKNEALETHYINQFELGYVEHPIGTSVYPTSDGHVLVTSAFTKPARVTNSDGLDVSSDVNYRDNVAYHIGVGTLRKMFRTRSRDYLEFALQVGKDADHANIVLRARNTLENTVLLYDVMMKDQGLSVFDWSELINSNYLYAWQLHKWYESVSGISISVEHDGVFEQEDWIRDTGPIAWKEMAARVPLGKHGDSVHIRLSFVPDSWNIDWAAFDFSEQRSASIKYVPAASIHQQARLQTSLLDEISSNDDRYLVTNPGDWMDITFDLPAQAGPERTLFVHSKGYYVEWIRPEWMLSDGQEHPFDISEPEQIRKRLVSEWLAKKENFEQEFYSTKIPVTEPTRPW